MPCGAAAAARAGGRFVIKIEGPEHVTPGEEIEIRVTGSGSASGGSVETAGLEVLSAQGGFSTPQNLAVVDMLGGLTAVFTCRVTAPAGASCSFGLRDATASDPDTGKDKPAGCARWQCAVSAAAPPDAAPSPSATPSSADSTPSTWLDALSSGALQLDSVYWDDLCALYKEAPYQVIECNAYLSQESSWEEYSLFMYDNGFVIIPFDANGEVIEPDAQKKRVQATGQHMLVLDAQTNELVALQDVVTKGDVTGSGQLGVSQLVRLARAMRGTQPLIGLYGRAGDLNGNGRIDLSDLICLAAWLRGRFVEL